MVGSSCLTLFHIIIIIIIIIYFAQQYKTAVTNINSQQAGQ